MEHQQARRHRPSPTEDHRNVFAAGRDILTDESWPHSGNLVLLKSWPELYLCEVTVNLKTLNEERCNSVCGQEHTAASHRPWNLRQTARCPAATTKFSGQLICRCHRHCWSDAGLSILTQPTQRKVLPSFVPQDICFRVV